MRIYVLLHDFRSTYLLLRWVQMETDRDFHLNSLRQVWKLRTFATLLLCPPDARGVEEGRLEARCRGREGLLPQVQAQAKASQALTYNGRAGKQREKNGARLTGGHA